MRAHINRHVKSLLVVVGAGVALGAVSGPSFADAQPCMAHGHHAAVQVTESAPAVAEAPSSAKGTGMIAGVAGLTLGGIGGLLLTGRRRPAPVSLGGRERGGQQDDPDRSDQ